MTVLMEAARWVEERFGHLDVLINNAGITGSGHNNTTAARCSTL
jgi:NAD(P)-dependent dehydrogenase (short-subunit alcohol dehydrogenase family)